MPITDLQRPFLRLPCGPDAHFARPTANEIHAKLCPRPAECKAGVDSAALSRDPRSSGSGVEGMQVNTYQHKFDLEIGTARFENAPIVVADIDLKDSDMLLGMDFMRHRRVWVSYSTGWVFMQLATEKS